jgi:acyl-CoA dehydrogenase
MTLLGFTLLLLLLWGLAYGSAAAIVWILQPPLAWLLRLVVLPIGLPFQQPTDSLDHQVARILIRAKRVGQLRSQDIANLAAVAVSLGTLSESEKVAIDEADRLRSQIIRVNSFSQLGALLPESEKQASKGIQTQRTRCRLA